MFNNARSSNDGRTPKDHPLLHPRFARRLRRVAPGGAHVEVLWSSPHVPDTMYDFFNGLVVGERSTPAEAVEALGAFLEHRTPLHLDVPGLLWVPLSKAHTFVSWEHDGLVGVLNVVTRSDARTRLRRALTHRFTGAAEQLPRMYRQGGSPPEGNWLRASGGMPVQLTIATVRSPGGKASP